MSVPAAPGDGYAHRPHRLRHPRCRCGAARAASLERELAAWDYEATRVDVFTATTKAFVGVLGAQAQLGLSEDLVRLAEQVLSTIAARVQAGHWHPAAQDGAL